MSFDSVGKPCDLCLSAIGKTPEWPQVHEAKRPPPQPNAPMIVGVLAFVEQ